MNTEDSVKVERNMQVLRSLQQREEQLVHALALCHEVVHELEAIHKSINIVLSILFPQETQNNDSISEGNLATPIADSNKVRELQSEPDSETDIAQENHEVAQVVEGPNSTTDSSKEPLNGKCKSLSNKSKFLNDEQRKKVIEYITDSKEQEAIKALPSHKRVSYIQKQLQEKYSINLSFYHASNIIKEYIVENK